MNNNEEYNEYEDEFYEGPSGIYEIVGMREEKYIGDFFEERDSEIEKTSKELTRYVICCKGEGYYGSNMEIVLYNTYGISKDGKFAVSWGHMEINDYLNELGEITHIPVKNETLFYDKLSRSDVSFECEAFSYDEFGDTYEPSGKVEIKDGFFIEKEKVKNGELDDISVEDLEKLLQRINIENAQKKEEIERAEQAKRQELIRKIRAAQEESLELDNKLRIARGLDKKSERG